MPRRKKIQPLPSEKIQIEHMDVQELKPADYNPRQITTASFNGLKTSIKKYGMVDPIILNSTTGNIVSGHQRLKAAIDLGYTQVPVVKIEVDETTEKSLNITLNNPNISGQFTDLLQNLLSEIKIEISEDDFDDLRFDTLELPAGFDLDEGPQDNKKDKKAETSDKNEKITITLAKGQKEELIPIIVDFLENYEIISIK